MTSLIPLDAFTVDRDSVLPIYRQLYDLIQQGIITGKFSAESKLPSSRILSKELCISRSTVTTAYDQLIAEGYLVSLTGSATTVAAALLSSCPKVNKETKADIELLSEMLSPLARSYLGKSRKYVSYKQPTLAVSLPSRTGFPHALWGKLLAKHAKKELDIDAGYDHPSGIEPLKTAIADYLALARAVVASSKNVL
ncbi:MAG: GntR family transcriptional regulator, partial [Gammaproteobacteria bacterium]|nr:GntR family transcriptional regulator [Gammaproteobacteria bacterium]